MKKLLFLGLLSIAVISMSARDAHAWFLDCCRNWCCSRYTTTIRVRPYNAFSPVCYGSIVADGCMPINMYGGGCCQPQCMNSCFGCPSYGPGCCTSGCCDVGCLPAPGSFVNTQPGPATPPMQAPMGQGPQFVAPNPQMLNQSSYMVPMQPMYGPIQPMGYYQQQQPMPVNYYAPAYWYGR